ncbi:hypothetical protein [uncultured Clostridium sp.]|uniref:hypothetical protein n=1 Tax=uncultured Clostridium sp. TaxID=59620 RepID=UPI00263B1FBF|nr:hypothetical protein [uncultured Clostridium sp.]
MAKKKKISFPGIINKSKSIKQNLDLLDKGIEDLYQKTYMNSREDLSDSEKIRDELDDAISGINNKRYGNSSISNLTKIFSKAALSNATDNKNLIDSMSIFEDPLLMDNILATWMENKWIKDLDNEIDMILKYMPKLKEALECKKDCVLSADHFSKEYINFHNITSITKEAEFNSRMEEIKKNYNLDVKIEKWYDHAQKYGEEFVYIVPYTEAFRKLLKDRDSTIFKTPSLSEITLMENSNINESILHIDESTTNGRELIQHCEEIFNACNLNNVKITFKSGLLESAAEEADELYKTINENSNILTSVSEQYKYFQESTNLNNSTKISSKDNKDKFTVSVPDNLEVPDDLEGAEMMINYNSNKNDNGKTVKVPGCIIKTLKRENIIPIYIDNVCLGYYYFEFKNDYEFSDPNNFQFNNITDSLGNYGRTSRREYNDISRSNRNTAINFLAAQLSEIIDSKFINANQDIKKELYMILQHNQLFNGASSNYSGGEMANINITFIPAEDIVHIYFNQDPNTKRGISDLMYSLFPAKLYASLYITDVLGRLTRGQDKRVYYVKQNIETNISKTLLNVINQIKKGNFGARQMENLSNILNITGRFNDYIIPLSSSGEAPVSIDVMQGQQFSDNSELMNLLEKMAINSTDVPYDLIEARQSLDYAIQATMSNSKLMRNVFKRQSIYQNIIDKIVGKIYYYEYDEDENIESELPAPSFINMTNGQQLIDGTVNYVEALINLKMPDETDEVKNEFRKLSLDYYLQSHISLYKINRMINKAKMNAKLKLPTNNEE